MSNVNGNTCLKSEKYRGLIIDQNRHAEFGSIYHSIFNMHNKKHVHTEKESSAKKIVDCYWDLVDGKYDKLTRYDRMIRIKAEALANKCKVRRK